MVQRFTLRKLLAAALASAAMTPGIAVQQELQLDHRMNEHNEQVPAGPQGRAMLETTVFQPNTKVPHANNGTLYDLVDFVSASESSKAADTYAAVTARSYHTGGVNAVFMDGSVHFISNNVAQTTWRALGTRASGDLVGDY